MTIEMGGFIGLAALMIGLFAWLRQDLAGVESRLGQRIDTVESKLSARIVAVEHGQAELRERMAKLEGLLEGLREAISGRRAAS